MFRGVLEPLHWHDWRVEVVVAGENLDADGVLCDFHEIEEHLSAVVAPFQNTNLNHVPPFGALAGGVGVGVAKPDLNPSAEHVARHIAQSLQAHLATRLAKCPKTLQGAAREEGGVRVESVSITEAEGCVAVYRLSGA